MRIVFKILAAPFVVVLTLLGAVLTFLFGWAKTLLTIVSGVAMLLAIIVFVTGKATNGIALTVIAFLLSPVGIPAIAEWLINRVGDLNLYLKNFITS